MAGAVSPNALERAQSTAAAQSRRRKLKQKIKRGEALKLINLGIRRYHERRLHRRAIRAILSILSRFRGTTPIERD